MLKYKIEALITLSYLLYDDGEKNRTILHLIIAHQTNMEGWLDVGCKKIIHPILVVAT